MTVAKPLPECQSDRQPDLPFAAPFGQEPHRDLMAFRPACRTSVSCGLRRRLKRRGAGHGSRRSPGDGRDRLPGRARGVRDAVRSSRGDTDACRRPRASLHRPACDPGIPGLDPQLRPCPPARFCCRQRSLPGLSLPLLRPAGRHRDRGHHGKPAMPSVGRPGPVAQQVRAFGRNPAFARRCLWRRPRLRKPGSRQ